MLASDVIKKIRIVKKTVRRTFARHEDVNHPIRTRIPRRLQEDGVNQAEDCRVSADTKTQNQDRGDSEAWRLQQKSDAVSHRCQETVHNSGVREIDGRLHARRREKYDRSSEVSDWRLDGQALGAKLFLR